MPCANTCGQSCPLVITCQERPASDHVRTGPLIIWKKSPFSKPCILHQCNQCLHDTSTTYHHLVTPEKPPHKPHFKGLSTLTCFQNQFFIAIFRLCTILGVIEMYKKKREKSGWWRRKKRRTNRLRRRRRRWKRPKGRKRMSEKRGRKIGWSVLIFASYMWLANKRMKFNFFYHEDQ